MFKPHVYFLICLSFITAQTFSQDASHSMFPTVSISGKFISEKINQPGLKYSPDGTFKVTYKIKSVTDEDRKLEDFKFYENDQILFTMNVFPGSDFQISNEGFIVCYDHSNHFLNQLTIKIFNKNGNVILEESTQTANAFKFSESGKFFAYRNTKKIKVFDLENLSHYEIEKGLVFCFDETGKKFAVSNGENFFVYDDGIKSSTIKSDLSFPREIVLSSDYNRLALINKNTLQIYSLTGNKLIYETSLNNQTSFRDLKFIDDKIIAGVHIKQDNISQGITNVYSINGKLIDEIEGEQKTFRTTDKSFFKPVQKNEYEPIPWPFFPFDSMRTVWNHYEQHMGGGPDWSYLHQGLDLITPIAEPTYAVKGGVVKLVLTLGGDVYWRLAISDSQNSGVSDGWLYAHLIESTIQFEVGDTVQVHDYLGDIVQWSSDWGHIHFVEIKDSGLVWLYDDDEWGINFNPLLALTPVNDYSSPIIDNVFPETKFAFCTNETSNYLSPDSLSGNVDIIVKVIDYAGDSEWQQPAFKIIYWIKRISDGEIILERKLSHILNHPYSQYESSYYEPFATVLYKRDNLLPSPSWMDTIRAYYHVLTNNNGDSTIELSEKDLSFNTGDFYDSEYRIYIEAYDAAGNITLDSMDVTFKNNILDADDDVNTIHHFSLEQNYPNPFNPSTKISWQSPIGSWQTIKVYDILGNEVATLVNEYRDAGSYYVEFDAGDLASGVYYYQLKAGDLQDGKAGFIQTKKMIYLK